MLEEPIHPLLSHSPKSQSMAQIGCFFSLPPAWHTLHRAGSRTDAYAWSVAAGWQLCLAFPATPRAAARHYEGLHQLDVNSDPFPEGPNLTGCPLVKGGDHNPMA